MFNIEKNDFEGLRESLSDFVRFEGRHPSDEELRSILCEELEALSIYTSDVISMWIAFGTPTCNTRGFMGEYSDIIDAIRTEVMYAFTAEARAWCCSYMETLREGQ